MPICPLLQKNCLKDECAMWVLYDKATDDKDGLCGLISQPCRKREENDNQGVDKGMPQHSD
jgi:hypothetical protein